MVSFENAYDWGEKDGERTYSAAVDDLPEHAAPPPARLEHFLERGHPRAPPRRVRLCLRAPSAPRALVFAFMFVFVFVMGLGGGAGARLGRGERHVAQGRARRKERAV